MFVVNPKKKSKRSLEIINNIERCKLILKKYFLKKNIFVNERGLSYQVDIIEMQKPDLLLINFNKFHPEPDGIYSLYQIISFYIHVSVKVIERCSTKKKYWIVKIINVAVAKQKRMEKRIKISDNEAIASNFKISKNIIEENTKHIPATVKIALIKIKEKLINKVDNIEVQSYEDDEQIKASLAGHVCRSRKPLIISNTSDIRSYERYNESYFDINSYLKNNISNYITKCKQRGVVSQICVPVIYVNYDRTVVPIGYIFLENNKRFFSMRDVRIVWKMVREIIKQIEKADTIILVIKEKVIDISHKGLLLQIKDKKLIGNLYNKTSFIFNITFKKQAPLSLFALIQSIKEIKEGYLVGLEIDEHYVNPNDLKRFYKNVEFLALKDDL